MKKNKYSFIFLLFESRLEQLTQRYSGIHDVEQECIRMGGLSNSV